VAEITSGVNVGFRRQKQQTVQGGGSDESSAVNDQPLYNATVLEVQNIPARDAVRCRSRVLPVSGGAREFELQGGGYEALETDSSYGGGRVRHFPSVVVCSYPACSTGW